MLGKDKQMNSQSDKKYTLYGTPKSKLCFVNIDDILSAIELSEFGLEALAGFGPVLPRLTRLKPLFRSLCDVFETGAIR